MEEERETFPKAKKVLKGRSFNPHPTRGSDKDAVTSIGHLAVRIIAVIPWLIPEFTALWK